MRSLAINGIVFFVLGLSLTLSAQTQMAENDPFMEYQAFLAQHKDMTTSDLLAMHPAGRFKEHVGVAWDTVSFHEFVDAACKLTAYEKSLLQDNGFVVTERFKTYSLIDQMVFAWNHDLPLFISADAILHALGIAYDKILSDVEGGVLNDRLCTLLSKMHASLPALAAKYSSDSRMDQMLRDVDVYLTVPRMLLGQGAAAHYGDNTAEVDQIVGMIKGGTFEVRPLFSTCREIDFSQFIPRGHYADDPILKKYFQAMMWLGRVELILLPPKGVPPICPEQSPQDIQRQTLDAVLLLELMDLAGVNPLYAEMDSIFSTLIGEQDNVTPGNLRTVIKAIGLADAAGLLDAAKLLAFQQMLAVQAFAPQRIMSELLQRDCLKPEEAVQPPSAFMLFGQRFIIDAYITGNVVYDRITYQDQPRCRLFPSTLDVLFALGNNAAGELLVDELNQYHYASNLAALRYLIDGHGASFWEGSIYNLWLNAIRALNPAEDREHLPLFMQTAAWSRQKMNTQLASWTELRHNHILYAKQSYTSWGSCSTPCGYVEPCPELYQRLNKLGKVAHRMYAVLSFSSEDLKGRVIDYFDTLEAVTEMLAAIARKELDGTALSDAETTFIQTAIYSDWLKNYGPPRAPHGWYAALTYGAIGDGDSVPDQVVVDYHTTPSDCVGTQMGWVLHGGTGRADLAIVTARTSDGEVTAFVGPVMSYYEYTTTDFKRLNDEEWQWNFLPRAKRPGWVSSYLANSQGGQY